MTKNSENHDNGAATPGSAAHRLFVRMLKSLPQGVIRLAASPYIAGERLFDALFIADRLWSEQKILSTLDVLGEDVASIADIDAYAAEFHKLIDELRVRPHANISLKLTALGQELDERDCLRRAREIVEHAREVDSFVRLDMEDHETVTSTLRIYRELRTDFDNCGIVLQSRLFRTRDDVAALTELRANVRLCIGIYPEPASIALVDKDAMKRELLELAEQMWKNGQHVALATHEEWVIREALKRAARLGKADTELEVQMLLGVPRQHLQRELVERGIKVRLYVPYGRQWHAYSMRRLEYNPDMLKMTAANVIGGLFRRR
jgi:proline dehydrogenase